MGKSGPKRLSAAVLKARGSPLAAVREREERQQRSFAPAAVPVVYPLPRSLSKTARQWGVSLMRELIFTPTEHRLLTEFLQLWDHIQKLKADIAVHGESRIDKNGQEHIRPQARLLTQELTLLLAYARKLEVKDAP